jgi:hypothetical protein
MIRHPIEDLCRRQPVPQDLLPKILGSNLNPKNHTNLHSLHAAPSQQINFARRGLAPRLSLAKRRSSVMAIT